MASSPEPRRAGKGAGAVPRALVLAAVVAAAACATVQPGGRGARVTFSYAPYAPAAGDTARVTFAVDDGRGPRTASSDAFTTEDWATPHSRAIGVAARDSLRIHAVLQGPSGDTLAIGRLVLPPRPDWDWGIHAAVARRSTILRTPGLDARTFSDYWPLRGQQGEADPLAFYLTYRARPITNPGVQ